MKNKIFLLFFLFFVLFSASLVSAQYNSTAISVNLTSLVSSESRWTAYTNVFQGSNTSIYAYGEQTKSIYEFTATVTSGNFINLNTLSYTGRFYNLTGQTDNQNITNMYVHGLGTNLYFTTHNGDTATGTSFLHRYTFSQAYNISSINSSSTIASPQGLLTGVWISPNGLNLYLSSRRTSGFAFSAIQKYALPSPFDISSSVLSSELELAASTSCDNNNFLSIWVDSGETFFFTHGGFTGDDGRTVRRYNFNNGDVSTATVNFTQLSLGGKPVANTNPYNQLLIANTNCNNVLPYTDNNVMRFQILNSTLSAASQIANLDDEVLGFSESLVLSFDSYFTGYVFPFVGMTNINSGETVILSEGQNKSFTESGFPSLTINFTSDGDDGIRITSFSQEGDYQLTLYACLGNFTSCISQTADVTISSSAGAGTPQKIGEMVDYAQVFNTTKAVYNVNNFFINYNYLEVQQGTAIITSGQNTSTPTFQVALSANGTLQTTSFFKAGIFPITVLACSSSNKTTCVSDSFNVFVNTNGTLPSDVGQPQGLPEGGGLAGFILSFLPDADSLSLAQKMIYVVINMIIIFFLIFFVVLIFAFTLSRNGIDSGIIKGAVVACIFFEVLVIIFFIGVGYIPISVIVIGLLVSIFFAYFFFRHRGGT